MEELNAKQVHQYLMNSDNNPLLLDVREPWEFEICHIDGAEHIPMQSIVQNLERLDPEQDTIVICHHGIRSRIVGNFLERSGFKNIINLAGGVKSWAEHVDPAMPVY